MGGGAPWQRLGSASPATFATSCTTLHHCSNVPPSLPARATCDAPLPPPPALCLPSLQASALERLASALKREEALSSDGEAGRRELMEKLWDAEQRVRGGGCHEPGALRAGASGRCWEGLAPPGTRRRLSRVQAAGGRLTSHCQAPSGLGTPVPWLHVLTLAGGRWALAGAVAGFRAGRAAGARRGAAAHHHHQRRPPPPRHLGLFL